MEAHLSRLRGLWAVQSKSYLETDFHEDVTAPPICGSVTRFRFEKSECSSRKPMMHALKVVRVRASAY